MENNEIKGKIYTIRSPHTDKYYIGSTTQKYLCDRMSTHRYDLNNRNCASKQIFDAGDAYIELLELYNCNSKEELRRREGELIRLHVNNCVNKNIAGRTIKEYHQEYYLNNKEQLIEKAKEKISCECGKEITIHNIYRHKKSKKHLNFINQIVI